MRWFLAGIVAAMLVAVAASTPHPEPIPHHRRMHR